MDMLGMFAVLTALIVLIENIIFYKKKKITTAISGSFKKYKVVNNSYYKIQLGSSILFVLCTILLYIVRANFEQIGVYAIAFIGVYWSINYIVKFISIYVNYIEVDK